MRVLQFQSRGRNSISGRIASLDFVRSVAISLVLLAHSVLAFGAPRELAFLQLGGIGVDLFFVLSGWLLGTALLRELNCSGTINVKRFLYRRWLRTIPAYLAVLSLTLLQLSLTKPDFRFPFEYAVFGQNYSGLPIFHVSWSLCVEEHFYLLVGPMILIMRRQKRWLIPMIAATILFPLLMRIGGFYSSLKQTHVRFDGCSCGVLLAAIAIYRPLLWKQLTRHASLLAGVALVFLTSAFVSYRITGQPWFTDSICFNVMAMALIIFAVSSRRTEQRLTFPGCQFLATRSYAIYLLHPEVLAIVNRWGPEMPFWVYFTSVVLGSCVCGEVLYQCVEKPMMAWRDRLSFDPMAKGQKVAVASKNAGQNG